MTNVQAIPIEIQIFYNYPSKDTYFQTKIWINPKLLTTNDKDTFLKLFAHTGNNIWTAFMKELSSKWWWKEYEDDSEGAVTAT